MIFTMYLHQKVDKITYEGCPLSSWTISVILLFNLLKKRNCFLGKLGPVHELYGQPSYV